MLVKFLLAAVGVGFTAGVATSGKVGSIKKRVESTIKPKKNKVAHIKVKIEDGVKVEDLRFLVIQPVRNATEEEQEEV